MRKGYRRRKEVRKGYRRRKGGEKWGKGLGNHKEEEHKEGKGKTREEERK